MFFLSPELRKRFRCVNSDDYRIAKNSDYLISNYRYKSNFDMYTNNVYPYNNEVYTIKAGNNKITGIYKY